MYSCSLCRLMQRRPGCTLAVPWQEQYCRSLTAEPSCLSRTRKAMACNQALPTGKKHMRHAAVTANSSTVLRFSNVRPLTHQWLGNKRRTEVVAGPIKVVKACAEVHVQNCVEEVSKSPDLGDVLPVDDALPTSELARPLARYAVCTHRLLRYKEVGTEARHRRRRQTTRHTHE